MMKIIELCGREIEYDLQRKNVKNINLRIKADGSVSVSANRFVPTAAIEEILRNNAEYILSAVDKYKARAVGTPKNDSYSEGETVRLFGEDYPIVVRKGKRNEAAILGNAFVISVREPESADQRKKTAEKYIEGLCREKTSEIFGRAFLRVSYLYPEKFTSGIPAVKFRRMHTRWGICRPTRNEITFSYMLAKATEECIEYVAYHELCHFIFADHSKSFYVCLSHFLPDFKERKSRLDRISILK